MHYVDGFVVPVPKKNLGAYRRMADDVKPGKWTSFPQSVKLKRGETVVFAYIVYKSRAHRDSVNKKVMNDPKIKAMCGSKMPFDGRRMFWGGFKVMIEA